MEKVVAELEQQVKAEIGEVEEVNPEHLSILKQKYGLVTPQLTASEKRLIQREERKNAGK